MFRFAVALTCIALLALYMYSLLTLTHIPNVDYNFSDHD